MIFSADAMLLHRLIVIFFAISCSVGDAFSLSTKPPSAARRSKTRLFNIFDILSGPKLEAENNLPYKPPFCDELSVSNNGVRTFAIKERP